MEFSIEAEVFTMFPGITLAVAVGTGIRPELRADQVAHQWRAAWETAGRAALVWPNPQSHPRVKPWRDAFRAMGVSPRDYPSSIEAMLRRAMKGSTAFSVMPLVDFYNTVSLTHIVPVGGFDLDRVHRGVALRRTRSGDHYRALDQEEAIGVPPGEVAYADGSTILTRHFVWRQASEGLIRPTTRNVFLVSEVLGPVGRHVAHEVLRDLSDGLTTLFEAETATFILDAEHVHASW